MWKQPVPEDVSDLKGLIATILLWAPDAFDQMRQYPDMQPLSLALGFDLLNRGIEQIFDEDDPLRDELAKIFELAHWLYVNGDRMEAADTLIEADNLLRRKR